MDVKAIRKSCGESRTEFAKRVGASSRTVRRWENGEAEPSQMAVRQLEQLQAADAPESGVTRRRIRLDV